MGALGVIISAADGLVVATDTSLGTPGAANDSIRQLGRNTACFVYSPEADQVLQAYLKATDLLPATPEDFAQSLAAYVEANPPGAVPDSGFTIAGIDPAGVDDNTVREITWTKREVKVKGFSGNLVIGSCSSIARYLMDRIWNRNLSLEFNRELAVFLIAETHLALAEIRPHIAMATIDRDKGFQWEAEDAIRRFLDLARQKSHRLALGCVGLF